MIINMIINYQHQIMDPVYIVIFGKPYILPKEYHLTKYESDENGETQTKIVTLDTIPQKLERLSSCKQELSLTPKIDEFIKLYILENTILETIYGVQLDLLSDISIKIPIDINFMMLCYKTCYYSDYNTNNENHNKLSYSNKMKIILPTGTKIRESGDFIIDKPYICTMKNIIIGPGLKFIEDDIHLTSCNNMVFDNIFFKDNVAPFKIKIL